MQMRVKPRTETAEHKEQCARRTKWEYMDPKYVTEQNYYYPDPDSILNFIHKPYAYTGKPEDMCSRVNASRKKRHRRTHRKYSPSRLRGASRGASTRWSSSCCRCYPNRYNYSSN